MQSSVYWAQRFERMNDALLAKGGELLKEEIAANFKRAQREIEKEIAKWFQRLADNNG